MQAREDADGTLVVTHDSTALSKWLFAIGLVCVFGAAYDGLVPSAGGERVLGLVGAAATLLLIGLAFAESGRFTIDATRRVVEWRRRWAWWRRAGTIPFDDVRDVLIERPIGDEGIPSRRIVLRLASGEKLPIQAAYVPDHGDRIVALAEQIRGKLGQVGRPAPTDAVRALVAEGRTLEAVKLLREQKDVSLSDAMREIDELRPRPP